VEAAILVGKRMIVCHITGRSCVLLTGLDISVACGTHVRVAPFSIVRWICSGAQHRQVLIGQPTAINVAIHEAAVDWDRFESLV